MTLAIAVMVNDGVILGADSAATMHGLTRDGRLDIVNVFNNADKIVNLRKGMPLALMTWGSGSIGSASFSTIAKDLRNRFSGYDSSRADWQLDPSTFTVSQVAERVREFMFEEMYQPAYGEREPKQRPYVGYLIAGYSAGSTSPETYKIQIANGDCIGPEPGSVGHCVGAQWYGQPEAVSRLLLGFSTRLPDVLREKLGVPEDEIGPAMEILQRELQMPFVWPPMPVQDAIDLVDFLVDVSIRYSKFGPGWPIVGGPIEIAAITKHEGFKWIRRKHYYEYELNPEEAPWNTPALLARDPATPTPKQPENFKKRGSHTRTRK